MIGLGHGGRATEIAIVSEVSVGYGTPQVIRLADTLASAFGATVIIYEPDQPERPAVDIARHARSARVRVQRVVTSSHPYGTAGRIEFCLAVSKELNEHRPRVIVVCASYGLPIFYDIDPSQSFNIFYCLEHIPENPEPTFGLVGKSCNLVLFPERNRARIYAPRLGIVGNRQEIMIVMNGNYPREGLPGEKERIPRVFYGGTFHREMTCADIFLESDIARYPIDVYGIIDGFPDRAAIARQMHGNEGGIRYCGYLEADDVYFETLARYQYSLVIWNPSNDAQLYAAPNKMFDAIACGVPPLCAPHPQCEEIIRRWQCGVMFDNWSVKAVRARLEQVIATFGTTFHDRLVLQCKAAMNGGLDWDSQCDPVVKAVARGFGQSIR